MTYNRQLILRTEENSNERRTPLTPSHAQILRQHGVNCLIESSDSRIFTDNEYLEAGCEVIPAGSWINANSNTLVLGLKALPSSMDSFRHNHIFFAHAYRGQSSAQNLLRKFVRGNGTITDLECITNSQGQRLTSMSHYAGIAGAIVGLNQLLPTPYSLTEQVSEDTWIERFLNNIQLLSQHSYMVTGAQGKCGHGTSVFLRRIGIEFDIWTLEDSLNGRDIRELRNYNVILHAAALNTVGGDVADNWQPFLTNSIAVDDHQLRLIVDITADTGSPYNLLGFDYIPTNFDQPSQILNTSSGGVEVIAIDHLPTLLARESSMWFSSQLLAVLSNSQSEAIQNSIDRFNLEIETLGER